MSDRPPPEPLTASRVPERIAISGWIGEYYLNGWTISHDDARQLRDSLDEALGRKPVPTWWRAESCSRCKRVVLP